VAPSRFDDHPSRSHEQVEQALRRLGEQVEVPPLPQYAALVRQGLEGSQPSRSPAGAARHPRNPRPYAAAVALLAAIAMILGVPATRHAVADLFGLRGVRVHTAPTGGPSPRTTLDTALELGNQVTLAEARNQLPFRVATPTVSGLGQPDAVYVRRAQGLQVVNLVFRPRPGLPAAVDSHVGLLLSEYQGTAAPYFDKYVDAQVPPVPVSVGGRWSGLYFAGEQRVFVRDPGGTVHSEQPRLSAPSVVWVQGAITCRLEANIDLAHALAIAESLD
jgi:hypothetical protein